MQNTYVIAWKSKAESLRSGQGKKLYTREEAQELAGQMNRDYPGFIHEPLNLAQSESRSAECQSAVPQAASLPDSQPAPENILTPDFAPAEFPQLAPLPGTGQRSGVQKFAE